MTPKDNVETPASGRLKILVAEDEALVRTLLRRFLVGQGYAVKTVDSGAEAIEALESEPFDAVISDYEMPGLNGAAFYSRLLESAPHLRERFLLITGTGFTSEVTRFTERSGVPYLLKPFGFPELTSALNVLLSSPCKSAG